MTKQNVKIKPESEASKRFVVRVYNGQCKYNGVMCLYVELDGAEKFVNN